jgi:hypothetical protein
LWPAERSKWVVECGVSSSCPAQTPVDGKIISVHFSFPCSRESPLYMQILEFLPAVFLWHMSLFLSLFSLQEWNSCPLRDCYIVTFLFWLEAWLGFHSKHTLISNYYVWKWPSCSGSIQPVLKKQITVIHALPSADIWEWLWEVVCETPGPWLNWKSLTYPPPQIRL